MKRSPGLIRVLAAGALATTAAPAVETQMQELSLSDLMGLQNAIGTLTRMEKNKVPVSVTTITQEDIRMTPARNLLDLIEALVPGAMYTDHPEQARLGMRGVIADRNYKFLLLVDGHLMNQKTHSGVVSEIQNWDMNDIKEVRIIRGPGSVTYGPGAVAGVVAITTKKAEDQTGLAVSSSMAIPYSSQGGTVQYGRIGNGWSLYSYLNATWTRGYTDPKAFAEVGNSNLANYTLGEIGTGAHTNANRKYASNDILADFDRDVPHMPQLRAHLGANLPMGFTTFARYTQGGTTTGAAWSKQMSPESLQVNARTLMYRQAVGSIQHQVQFTDEIGLSSKLEAGSQDFERYSGTTGDKYSLNSPLNTTHNFAESDVTVQSLLNTSFLEKFQVALGAEYVYSKVGAGWFDEPQALKFGDAQNIISGKDSWLGNTDTTKSLPTGKIWTVPYSKAGSKAGVFVGDGIDAHTISLMTEANLAFHDYATVLLSGRADKNTYSTWMVSPRVALVSAIDERNIVKLIWQQSMRMSTLEQMYLEDLQGNISDPEVLEGVEVIYTALPTDALKVNLSGYRNNVETLAWSTVATKTELQGDMVIFGGEADVQWKGEAFSIGLNHASSMLESFELRDGQKKSGVSYADQNLPVVMTTKPIPASGTRAAVPALKDTALVVGAGSAINNWSEHITKAMVRYRATPSLTLQATSRVFWGFQGYQDQLASLRNLKPYNPADTAFIRVLQTQVDSLVDLVEAEDAYGAQMRFDVSAEWAMSENVRLTGMVQNLFGTDENRRYDYISGLNQTVPRTAWVEEPRTFYLKLTSTF